MDMKKQAINHEVNCLFYSGAANEARTRDPQLGKLMLYRLSYCRIEGCRRGKRRRQPVVSISINALAVD